MYLFKNCLHIGITGTLEHEGEFFMIQCGCRLCFVVCWGFVCLFLFFFRLFFSPPSPSFKKKKKNFFFFSGREGVEVMLGGRGGGGVFGCVDVM